MSLKERFNRLSPFQKHLCIWSLVGAGVLTIVAVGYKTTRSPEAARKTGQEKTREISLDPDLIQKTMLREQRKEIEAMQVQLAKLAKQEEAKAHPEPPPAPVKSHLPEIPSADQVAKGATGQTPQMPVSSLPPRFPAPPVQTPPPPPKEEKIIGGIGILSSQSGQPPAAKEQAGKDKKKGSSTFQVDLSKFCMGAASR